MADYTPDYFTLNVPIDLDRFSEKHKVAKANMPRAFTRGLDRGLKRLETLANKRLTQELSAYGLGDSNISRNIIIMREPDFGFSITGLGYIVYLEYGTGWKAQSSSSGHPNPSSWEDFQGYDINNYGIDGWYYKDDRTGEVRWTNGQLPKPVLHNTWRYIRQAFDGTINASIERELRKELGI